MKEKNLHERCNQGARHRWGIEEAFLVEKRHGYRTHGHSSTSHASNTVPKVAGALAENPKWTSGARH